MASKHTQCVHAGAHHDLEFKGGVTPVYPATAYDYEEIQTQYPRYFNTPNQKVVAEKLAALENAEAGLIFGSGMAAILTSIFAMLKSGDHAIFQNDLYGGTFHGISKELPRYNIAFSVVDGSNPENFENAIREETKLLYIETPSNPTLKITNIKAVADIAKKHGLITIIDNTFASPINQNPISLGVDIVAHSGTKYIGGHSDLSCGAVLSSSKLIEQIWNSAIHFGGMLDPHVCFLVERSLKTMALRVQQQNNNAMKLATWLSNHHAVENVYYPGLTTHPGHTIAKTQMPGGFGGMLSFELNTNPHTFLSKLKLIKRAISLGGVESTMCSPAKTSHVKMTSEERAAIGVKDNLIRFSVGIEEVNDIIADIEQAMNH